ncbi:uncharacterized protein BYT42DRAFT_552963 [Radiomyces spectabilis]|uniref:uncharacterized protein n=1 Tax=Radiomyces spectabilis TaxID=64574 RepID=UPI00221F3647|nr:uncharacterized protein BYT42DRAFT_552963 [Radiomyces spectabilis]KAI8393988.1 hypothetical protein BYT42DRAFT_552963 [Radiomyces spectabilis]
MSAATKMDQVTTATGKPGPQQASATKNQPDPTGTPQVANGTSGGNGKKKKKNKKKNKKGGAAAAAAAATTTTPSPAEEDSTPANDTDTPTPPVTTSDTPVATAKPGDQSAPQSTATATDTSENVVPATSVQDQVVPKPTVETSLPEHKSLSDMSEPIQAAITSAIRSPSIGLCDIIAKQKAATASQAAAAPTTPTKPFEKLSNVPQATGSQMPEGAVKAGIASVVNAAAVDTGAIVKKGNAEAAAVAPMNEERSKPLPKPDSSLPEGTSKGVVTPPDGANDPTIHKPLPTAATSTTSQGVPAVNSEPQPKDAPTKDTPQQPSSPKRSATSKLKKCIIL